MPCSAARRLPATLAPHPNDSSLPLSSRPALQPAAVTFAFLCLCCEQDVHTDQKTHFTQGKKPYLSALSAELEDATVSSVETQGHARDVTSFFLSF